MLDPLQPLLRLAVQKPASRPSARTGRPYCPRRGRPPVWDVGRHRNAPRPKQYFGYPTWSSRRMRFFTRLQRPVRKNHTVMPSTNSSRGTVPNHVWPLTELSSFANWAFLEQNNLGRTGEQQISFVVQKRRHGKCPQLLVQLDVIRSSTDTRSPTVKE